MQPRRTDAFLRTGAAGPGCQAATVADGRRKPETARRGGGSVLLGCRGGLKDGERKPATGGWRAGGRARDASRLVNSILLTLTEHTLREQPFRRD